MTGLGGRIGLALALAALLPLLAMLLALWPAAREVVVQRAALQLEHAATEIAQTLDARFAQVEISARILADDLATDRFDAQRAAAMLGTRVRRNPDVHAAQLLLESTDGTTARFGLHLGQRGERFERRDFVADGYEFLHRNWYRAAQTRPSGSWTAPYFNSTAGGRDTVTFHLPLRLAEDGSRGLLSLDVALDRIEAGFLDLSEHVRRPPGRAALVDPDGRLLVSHDPLQARTGRLPAGHVLLAGDTWVAQAAAGRAAQRLDDAGGAPHLGVAAEIGQRGWRVLLSLPMSQVLGELDAVASRSVPVLAGLLLLLLALAWLASRRLVRPLAALADAADRIAAADFSAALTISTRRDEVGRLQRSLESARRRLAETHTALDVAGERDQRLAVELGMARDIQRAMQPRDRVFLGHGRALRVAGALIPAKAVGGDFYLFFAPQRGEVLFAIGDVSDKGVPSALFAARLQALLSHHAQLAESPGALLAGAAAELYRDNDTGLFATAVVGHLRLDDGLLRLASAGHEAPLRLGADGRRDWLEIAAGPALGFSDDANYPVWQDHLQPGEQLILYTDGVTEAMTRDHEIFGSERIEVALERQAPRQAALTVAAIAAEVECFVDGADPADDLTLLVLEYAER